MLEAGIEATGWACYIIFIRHVLFVWVDIAAHCDYRYLIKFHFFILSYLLTYAFREGSNPEHSGNGKILQSLSIKLLRRLPSKCQKLRAVCDKCGPTLTPRDRRIRYVIKNNSHQF